MLGGNHLFGLKIVNNENCEQKLDKQMPLVTLRPTLVSQ